MLVIIHAKFEVNSCFGSDFRQGGGGGDRIFGSLNLQLFPLVLMVWFIMSCFPVSEFCDLNTSINSDFPSQLRVKSRPFLPHFDDELMMLIASMTQIFLARCCLCQQK